MYICPACSLVLREPYQLPCGHRQCKTCIDAGPSEIIECSECGTVAPKHEIMPDRGCRNDMKLLPVVCSLCAWNGIFKEYEEHRTREHSNLTGAHDQQGFSVTTPIGENNGNSLSRSRAISTTTHGSCLDLPYMNGSFNNDLNSIQQSSMRQLVDRAESQTFSTHDESALGMEISVAQAQASATPTLSPPIETNTETIQERMNVIAEQIHHLHENIDRLHQYDIQLRHAPMSCDGILTWKITGVREKMMDAQSERQTSIYSPPFYSSPSGYKMQVRLFLNGDGTARRTHMSLFFVLMRGLHDPILPFPFDYNVIFCLHDQATQEKHIIDSFHPDVQSSSFQRPRSETNIPIGIPKFCPLALIELEGNPYVQDDTMFIRVIVDFANLPEVSRHTLHNLIRIYPYIIDKRIGVK